MFKITLVGLTIQLKQLGISVRPISQIKTIENFYIFKLFLNLHNDDELDLATQLGREFIIYSNGVGETIELDLSICSTLL
jgi:hypothetical protein